MTYRMESAYRRVFVQDVVLADERAIAHVVDVQTGNMFTMSALTPDNRLARVGEVWMCTRDTGPWRFSGAISPPSWANRPDRTFGDVLERLESMGTIHWQPDDSPTIPERPHLAYLGEFRVFIVDLQPSGWLRCDGTAVSRNRWRDLFNLIGTDYGVGDGSTTFNLPSVTMTLTLDSGPGVDWYICGE